MRREVRHAATRLLPAAVAVYLLLAGTGLLLTRVLSGSAVVRADQRVSRWFFQHRTAELNSLTHVGSMLSDTKTVIAVTVVLVVALRLWCRRWRESIAIVLCILGELTIFLGVTSTVHRTRPTVPHLDPAPPTSSFPSGHTGAAVALYVGLAVILLVASRGSAGRPAALIISALLCCIPIVVGISRIYRGMHFATDVLAGACAGGLWMAVVMRSMLGAQEPR